VKFHKDGYTDHRGRFEYTSVSTPERQQDSQFVHGKRFHSLKALPCQSRRPQHAFLLEDVVTVVPVAQFIDRRQVERLQERAPAAVKVLNALA